LIDGDTTKIQMLAFLSSMEVAKATRTTLNLKSLASLAARSLEQL
jgi:hypothetical protein